MVNWMRTRLRHLGAKPAQGGKYLYRLIWLGCISVCIPIILACAVYYQFSMNRVNQEIINQSQASLVSMKDRAERILQGIEQQSLQLAIDPIVSDFFTKGPMDNTLVWHQQLLDRIALLKNSNGFIDEIYFYNTAEDLVLSNRYGAIAKESYKYKNDIDRLLANVQLSQWAYMPISQKDGFITFARMLPVVSGGKPQGILAFEIEMSAVSNFLQTDTLILPTAGLVTKSNVSDQSSQGQDLLITNYQKLFDTKTSERAELSSMLLSLPAIQQIRASDKGTDNFYAQGLDGEKAHFLYMKNVFGRTYITVISEQQITNQLNWIRGMTLLILFFFIVLGVLLTYFNTKRAYNPIEQLINHSKGLNVGRIPSKENEFDYIKACLDFLNQETEKLGSYMEKIEPTLREKCLQQLLGGDYVRQEALVEDCEAYGIPVRATYVVLVAEAENITKDTRFLPEEKGVIAFVIANVMQEMLQMDSALRGYVMPYQGRGVVLMHFAQGKEQSALLQQTLKYAQSVCASLKNVLKIDVSVGIGRYYAHVADVPVSYKEADTALQYRMYKETDHVLFIEDLEHTKKPLPLRYPKQLEQSILNTLEAGEMESAARYLSEFADVLRESESYVFIYQSYHMLLSSIITSLEKQGGSLLDILEHNVFGQLKNKTTSKDIYDWFVETLFPLYQWLTESGRTASSQSVIQLICKHIKENSTSDVSLVQCADMVGMSASYLSRLFKKETGMNFLDYVVECKLEEAKKLLTETDQSVSEIATAIGYSERNLNRIFQRLTQTSPSVFRSKHR
ncbi:helix-turn-helix domain-containing protein [Paenibacillus cremeus]|uniref:Helix-turn-helix domain-containing protein n=1 Tax=Paenibacillus cremeus TaxID=2163881 RepID=A0A559KFX7_9BACL|nr:helix-turn-helix domain-containing protein [Paenibacillus cremeus]TVY11034.1 helix-turn-helix domain-containing protein [Paenibacillus cremeus]